MRFGKLVLACACLPAFVLSGCGGGDGDSSQSEDGLKDAARAATEALFAGELRDAYDSFSAECQEQTPFAEFSSSVTIASAFLEALSGAKLEDFEVTDVRVRNFEGDTGEVMVVVQAPEGQDGFSEEEEWIEWAFEDDRWVQTDCDDLGLDGGGDEPTDEPTEPAATVPPPGQGPEIGTTFEAGGSLYTVNSVEDPAEEPEDEFFGPEEGNRWVVLDITQEAAGGEDSAGPWDFTVQDEDGFIYEWTFGEAEPEFPSVQLADGQRVRGYLTFEIPEDAVLVAVYADADFPRPPVMIADLTR